MLLKKYLYALCLSLLVLAGPLSSCSKSDGTPAVPPSQTNLKITADNYNSIAVGMTYTQMVALLGNPSMTVGTTYSWSADDTNTIVIYVIIVNGTVQSKSQVGVVSTVSSGGACPATFNGHTIYVGPRGGCYYINSSGNKTYI